MYTLITGASGEIGTQLIKKIRGKIIATDIIPPNYKIPKKAIFIKLDITKKRDILSLFKKYKFGKVFHLAAILSSAGEKDPQKAIDVNLNGTLNLMQASQNQKTVFVFPSSIAVYNMESLALKKKNKKVKEGQFLVPTTVYGISKLFCERLGEYYYAKTLSKFNFRSLRFPGLLSAETVPSGGTSDFGPEMLHAAAQKRKYECFVNPQTKIPFMAMPDAVNALISISSAPDKKLSQRVYNVTSFSATAAEIEKVVKKHFPDFQISYKVNQERQKIVDSWPADIDDKSAMRDWGWTPKINFTDTFEKYLIGKFRSV
jgi:threonine 3-dehydrogenase